MLQSVIKLSHEKFPNKTLHFTGQETYLNYFFLFLLSFNGDHAYEH